MSEASRARLNDNSLTIIVGREGNVLGQTDNLLLADSQLTHASFTPSIQCTIVHNRKGIEGARRDIGYIKDAVLAMEEFHKRGCSCNLHSCRET